MDRAVRFSIVISVRKLNLARKASISLNWGKLFYHCNENELHKSDCAMWIYLGLPGQDAVQLVSCCEPENKPHDDMKGG